MNRVLLLGLLSAAAAALVGTSVALPRLQGGEPAPQAIEIETSAGSVTAVLDPGLAPSVCARVAQLVSEGRYDGLAIDRVLRGALVQFGSQDESRAPCRDDAPLSLDLSPAKHVRGALTLWRPGIAGEDLKVPRRGSTSNGTFFVCLDDEPWMDGRYCVFGRVTSGMEVLDELGKQPLVLAANGELSKPKEPARVVAVRLVPVPQK